ncbi:ribosome assembly protein 4 [Nostoc sp. FACHB-892]|nr:ribosome assembly protein 4 [Nostoc sp. FACHB-892]
MVVGLESVQNLSVMLTSANQVREDFRKNFAFPLVLWIDDEIYKQLIQLAPDLESWATTRDFAISTQELIDFISETANQWFSNNLKFSVDVYIKLEKELEAARKYLLSKPDIYNLETQANLESLLGFVKQINNQKDSALEHYHKALELWQQNHNLERQTKILGEIGFCYYLKAFKHQDINHSDWQTTWHYIQEYINFISQFRSPDLIANAVVKFGDILRELQKWETLQSLSEQALVIHRNNNQLRELAKDYGFLAEVALAQNNWVQANQLVKQALEVFAAIPNLESANISGVLAADFSQDLKNLSPNLSPARREALNSPPSLVGKAAGGLGFADEVKSQVLSDIPERDFKSKDLSLYQFILSRSQYHLGQTQQATLSLETARDVGNPLEDVRLYLDILRFLQQLYFEQKEYLKAYNIKQQQRSIEQQFGLRAFIGAGRLEATKQAFVETLRSNSPQGNIAPEIAASGRLLDVERLIERMGRPDYKLIVIHGQSGVGKSSLVNAGLIPALKNKAIGIQDYLPVVMRVYTNWVEELSRLLRKSEESRVCRDAIHRVFPDWRQSELGTSTSELGTSTSELGTSTSELGTSTSELGTSTSEFGTSTSELGTSTSELGTSTSELGTSTSELGTSTFDIQNTHSLVLSSSSRPSADAMNRVSTKFLITQLRENEQRNLRTVLIFDQFEEFFFVYTEPAQRKQFFEFLGECLNVLSVKVILSLRVDYIHYLLECNDLSSLKIIGNDILSNNVLYKLGNFSRADAKSIIQRLTENTSFRLECALVQQLVQDLAGELGEVRPIELQVVGAQLQTENITTLAEYRKGGTKDELVKRYLNEVVNDCGEENQQAADILLYLLTDEKGTRPLKTRAELERDLLPYLSEIPPTPLKKGGFILSTPFLTTFERLIPLPQPIVSFAVKFKSPFQNLITNYELRITNYLKAGGSEARAEQASEISKLDLVLEIFVQSGLVVLLPENPADRYQLVHDYIAAFIRQQQEPKLKQVMAELEKEREQRKISEAKLNNFLKRAFFGSVAAGLVLAGLTFTAWDAAQRAEKEKKQAEISEINALVNSSATFSASGQTWDALTESLKARGKLKNAGKVAVDTQMRVVGTLRKAVYLQPENKFQELNTLEGHNSSVSSVVFSSDGQRLASASVDNTIKLWDVASGKAVQTLTGHSSAVISVVFSPDGQRLASASADNTIKLWDVASGKAVQTLTGHSSAVYSVVFSPDGQRLASASADNTIKLWDVASGKAVQTLTGHSSWVYSVVFSPNGQRLASASVDNTIKLWDVATGKAVQTLTGHSNTVISVVFSPDGQRLASASADNTIKLWDVASGKAVQTLTGHSSWVYSVVFSPDGQRLASASYDNTIKLWDVASGKAVQTLTGHSSSVYSVVFSPDGQRLASASYDNTIKLWDVATGKAVQTLTGHSSSVYSVVFSPDGQRLASASADNTIKLWHVATGKAVQTLTGHSSPVISVVFSPDEQRLASASADKTIIIWNLDLNKLVKDGCGLLNNYLVVYPEVLQELTECQTPPRLVQAATVLVIQGEKLARNEDIDNAVVKFRKAQQWDANLRFEPNVKAQEFLNKGKAERSVAEGNSRLQENKFKETLAAYTAALKLDPKVEIPADSWNTLCWRGSLQKQAADVLPACEQAVALAPEDGNIRSVRGLARALTGNYQGAIEDFEAYIAQTEDKDSKAQRQRWVKDLRAGKNPFTDAEIKKLQN